MRIPLTILIFILCCSLHAQRSSGKYSRWPYIGDRVPRYIGILAGYEGLKTNNFQGGVAVNLVNLSISSPIGGMIGGCFLYKQNAVRSSVYSYEVEAGIYGGIVIGINYNYNNASSEVIHGIKPFAGLAFYNFQAFYGYSFYNSKDDINSDLRHNRITFRYIIPVVKLTRK